MADASGRRVVQLGIHSHWARATGGRKLLDERLPRPAAVPRNNDPRATKKEVWIGGGESSLVAPGHWVSADKAQAALRRLGHDPTFR
jgi:hypothetical protein